jgi:excisionase family DNA binding protein
MAKSKNKKKRHSTSSFRKKAAVQVAAPAIAEPQIESAAPASGTVSPEEPLLLTISQVGALLNLSRSTLHRLAKDDQIPGRIKIGGQVRYHRSTLEHWLLMQLG